VKLEQGKSQIWPKQNVNPDLKKGGTMKRRRRIRAKIKQGRHAIYYQDGENHFLGDQDVALEMRSGKQSSTGKKTNLNVKKRTTRCESEQRI